MTLGSGCPERRLFVARDVPSLRRWPSWTAPMQRMFQQNAKVKSPVSRCRLVRVEYVSRLHHQMYRAIVWLSKPTYVEDCCVPISV